MLISPKMQIFKDSYNKNNKQIIDYIFNFSRIFLLNLF